jgi:predicted RNA-binding protein with RPS1 domain
MVVSGAVTRIEPHGVFVALDPPPKDDGDGGGDGRGPRHPQQYRGLAHVSALRPPEQGRVEHPSEIVKLDERVTALVLEVIPPEEVDGAGGGGLSRPAAVQDPPEPVGTHSPPTGRAGGGAWKDLGALLSTKRF